MSVHKIEDRQSNQFFIKRQPIYLSAHLLSAFVFACNVIVFISMSVCLFDAHWITSDGFRQGLLYLCIEEVDQDSRFKNMPLPFDLSKDELDVGCYPNRDVGYLRLCTILCLLTILASLASASLAGLNMKVQNLTRPKYVRLATCTVLVALICNVSLLVIYPTQFRQELEQSNRDVWELNHAYGLAVGTAMMSFISLLFLFTRQSDTYKYNSAPIHL